MLLPLLAACSEDWILEDTLANGRKTPLTVTALLDASTPSVKSRAADKTIDSGDKLLVYIRHVKWNGGFTTADADKRTSITADQAPRLVTLTATNKSAAWSGSITDIYPFEADKVIAINGDNSQQATTLTASYKDKSNNTVNALYWDDFSANDPGKDGKENSTYLRDPNHYLQSYYGFCYNGGTPSVALTEGTGEIGWSVQENQSLDGYFRNSDLLWSAEQTPVRYEHRDTNSDNNRPGLVIPFTHAMSKVTIKVTAGTGFANNFDFSGTTIKLDKVRTSCTATAPRATLDYSGSVVNDVIMNADKGTGTRSFSAIIVPSVLTVGNTFATITNMDGNNYTIPVTEAMVKASVDGKDGWGSQLTTANEDVNHGTAQSRPRRDGATVPTGKGYQMKSGVHYILNVTLNETTINVSATILDWDEVEAEGVGEIHFANDITDKRDIAEALRKDGFDVYKSTTTTFGAKSTTLRWMKGTQKWKYEPVIYWQGGVKEYFRALSNVYPDDPDTGDNESLTMENNRDALWGTTEAHSGRDADGQHYDYAEGAPVLPRTGDVPLVFYHAMSKLTFNLVDANKDNTDPLSRLDLHNATIQLTDLANGGTLNLNTGLITASSPIPAGQKTFTEDLGASPSRMGYFAAAENGTTTSYNPDVTLKEYVITPQAIGNAANVVITLADGSVYKTQLNLCKSTVIEGGEPTDKVVAQWERGKHYIYTITLSKETITFRAKIKDWIDEEGSGNATLEWD